MYKALSYCGQNFLLHMINRRFHKTHTTDPKLNSGATETVYKNICDE